MKTILLVLLTLNSLQALSASPQALDKCLQDYAKNEIEEYNMPNEAILSADPGALKMTVDVLQNSGLREDLVEAARRVLSESQAVGLILSYQDEVQLLYVGVNKKGPQCEVLRAEDLNTVDISQNKARTLNPSNYFLGKSLNDLKEQFGSISTVADLYLEIDERLMEED